MSAVPLVPTSGGAPETSSALAVANASAAAVTFEAVVTFFVPTSCVSSAMIWKPTSAVLRTTHRSTPAASSCSPASTLAGCAAFATAR